jgi:hypothetical protein
LATDGLPKGFRQTYGYEWRLPDDPQPFCQAKILQARWLVKATVDRTLARDVHAEAPLYVVRPAPAQVSRGGESADENTAPDAVLMRFQLPRLEYVQGETVAGRVLIKPRQDINPRALNISLLRHEVVPVGDRTNVENVFERQQQFDVQLRAGQPSALDFEFAIPPNWCPTYASHNASVAWRVNATLEPPLEARRTRVADHTRLQRRAAHDTNANLRRRPVAARLRRARANNARGRARGADAEILPPMRQPPRRGRALLRQLRYSGRENLDRGGLQGGSPTVREGVSTILRRPPSRSGFRLAVNERRR